MNKENNCAFIDGNNLYLGARSQNLPLDYGRFRLYLRNALGCKKAYLFIGYVPGNNALYASLQRNGFILVFKPTVPYMDDGGKTVKGNVDAELVLYASAIEYDDYDKAVIVSSDGDFACLAKYLSENNKLERIITPADKYSSLLRPYMDQILPLGRIKNSIKPAKKKTTKSSKNRHSRSVQEP